MNTFLTPAEIHTLTGLTQPHAQVRYLREKLGIRRAYKNAANQVVVYRAWLDKDYHAAVPSVSPMPDFAAMDEVA